MSEVDTTQHEERESDSPFVQTVWRAQSNCAATFSSVASIHWEMVFTQSEGKTYAVVRGPETKSTTANLPADQEWVGITFKLGAFMPHIPPGQVSDLRDVDLPFASNQRFWLQSSTWEVPNFENADSFVERLLREGLLVYDPVVAAIRQGQRTDISPRTVQYHFVQATGLSHKTIDQIERAHQAMNLLQQGRSIFDTVEEAGYYDQPHLTRALRRYTGLTPSQIARSLNPTTFTTQP